MAGDLRRSHRGAEIGLSRQQCVEPGGVVQAGAVLDTVQLDPLHVPVAAPLLVRDAGLVEGVDHERAGADRLLPQVFRHQSRGTDHHPGLTRQDSEEIARRPLGRDLEVPRVDHHDLVDHPELIRDVTATLRRGVQIGLDRRRVERRTVLELHTVAQGQIQLLRIGTELPLLRQARSRHTLLVTLQQGLVNEIEKRRTESGRPSRIQ
jgi:hypothetical protein